MEIPETPATLGTQDTGRKQSQKIECEPSCPRSMQFGRHNRRIQSCPKVKHWKKMNNIECTF